MNAQLRDRLVAETTVGSIAYVRNLVAAEAALFRGQFNVAKILRASAHAQRTLAMNAARLTGASQDSVALLETILDEVQGGMAYENLVADDGEPGIAETIRQSTIVRQRLTDILHQAIETLKTNSDVLESDVEQWLYGCYSCGAISRGSQPDRCVVCGALETEFEPFGPYWSLTPEHLAQRTPEEIKAILAATPGQVASIIIDVPDDVLSRKPTPEEWNVKELVGHLTETDYLFMRTVETILSEPQNVDADAGAAPWDLHKGKGYERMSAAELVRGLQDSRAKSLAIVRELTPEQWCRRGPHFRLTRSLVDLGTWVANHDLGHMAQIRRLCRTQ